MHNREMVFRLQQAHASHIENLYTRWMSLPGNPQGIEILTIGQTKVFLSNQNRFKNRAIFTGNETLEELQAVTACFERKGVDGYFELNPANFYRTEPFSWKSEMVPALLALGYFPGDLRCVWVLDKGDYREHQTADIQVRRFDYQEADALVEAKLMVEPVEADQLEAEKQTIKHLFTEAWTYFIGYEGDHPVSISKLFMSGNVGLLAWGFTAKDYRRQGHHRVQALSRADYAFSQGCDLVFAVSDFNVPSSLSLQKVGFKLAYNYLLLEKRAAR